MSSVPVYRKPHTVIGDGGLYHYKCSRCGHEIEPKKWKYIELNGIVYCKKCYQYYKDGGYIK